MTLSLPPCTVNTSIVSGPTGRLDSISLDYQATKARVRSYDNAIHAQVQKRSYKNKDKTPTAVKVVSGIAVLAGVLYYIKNKFKK